MFLDFFARSGLLQLPVIALGIFFVTFIGVLIHVFLTRRNPHWKSMANLPLNEPEERTVGTATEGFEQ